MIIIEKFRKLKLKNKFILIILASIALIFIGLSTIIYEKKMVDYEKAEIIKTKIKAQYCAEKIINDFYLYYKDAETFNLIISNFKEIPMPEREKYFFNLMKSILEKDMKINALWAYLDAKDSCLINNYINSNPEKSDSNDSNFKDLNSKKIIQNPTDFFSDKKIFDVSWYRNGKNFYLETPWLFEEEALKETYFTRPILERKTIMSDPYSYVYANESEDVEEKNEQHFLISISSPVFDNYKNVIGVTGLDISLNNIINYIGSLQASEGGYIALISHEGKYLYHPNKSLLGKKLTENSLFHGKMLDSVQKLIAAEQEFDLKLYSKSHSENVILSYIPVYILELDFNIVVVLLTPYSQITKLSENLSFYIAASAIIAFLLLATVIILIFNKIKLRKIDDSEQEFQTNLINNLEVSDEKNYNSN